MKIASLISLVLTLALALACGGREIDADRDDPNIKTAAIVVTQDPALTTPTVQVIDPTYAEKGPKQIRWCVFNNTKVMLKEVKITNAPCNNPTLTLSGINPGNTLPACTEPCECGQNTGPSQYSINVTMAAGANPPSPTPRVILN